MIGYLAPVEVSPALKRLYRSHQCGLCHHLGAEYGAIYRLFAGPDMVFLNIFLANWGEPAAEIKRACVVAPVISSLPARVPGVDAHFAAAFGVYMAVEKLRDNAEDEGGFWRWAAWRALRGGHQKARAVLVAHGFAVEEVEAALGRQRVVEAAGALSLEAASEPTRSIAGALFAHAARKAGPDAEPGLRALGAAVGAYLFHMDNALDLPKDNAAGGYNALARAGLGVPDAMVAARQDVEELEAQVACLPPRPERTYVRHTLVLGFRDKIRRFEALSAEARPGATLRSLLPPRPRLPPRDALPILRQRLTLAIALLLAWIAPKSAWAQKWVPDTGADPSLDDTGAILDTGIAAEGATASATDQSLDCGGVVDPCISTFGWADCDCIESCTNCSSCGGNTGCTC